MFNIILAIDENYGIGKNNSLPWYCSRDLKHFKNLTIGNIIIVGRKTWQSMPQEKILKNRNVIVISSSPEKLKGVYVCSSLQSALNSAYENRFKSQEILVVGGASIYKDALQHEDLNCIHITYIHGKYDCDTFVNMYHYLSKFKKTETQIYEDCTICKYSK